MIQIKLKKKALSVENKENQLNVDIYQRWDMKITALLIVVIGLIFVIAIGNITLKMEIDLYLNVNSLLILLLRELECKRLR